MLLGLAAVWMVAAAPTNVAEWAAAYDEPTLGAPVDAAGRQLSWGHLTLTLASGRLHAVRVGGERAGVYFTGTGRLRYVSADATEATIYRRNAETMTDYRIGADGALEDTVSEALVLLSSAVPEDVAAPTAEPPRESVAALAAHLKRFADDVTPRYRQLMAQARLDPPAQPLVVAEIRGGRHDLLYLYDTLRDGEEMIGTLERVKRPIAPGLAAVTSGRWRGFECLSRQPIGRPRLALPPVPWILRKVEATVVNPRGNRLEVETRQLFEARQRVRVLDLFLATAYEADFSGDERYSLDAVVDGSGRPLAVARQWGDLLVELPAALEPGQTVELTFRMSGDVLYRPEGDNYWALTGGWYPSGRAQTSSFTYRGVVKVPKPFTPFSSATTMRRWDEGGLACAEFSQTKAIRQADILAGKYTTHVDARPGLTVRVSSYGLAKPGASKQIASIVHAFVAFYEPLLGRFPFSELEVLEINSLGFGMAPAGMIFITREAFNPLTDSLTQHFVKGINARLAHEVAHAWWGHAVRPAGPADRWMSESLAEYYSALAMQLRDPKDFGRMLDEWKRQAKSVRGWGSVYLAYTVGGDDRFLESSALLYAKGPLVLHALRQEIGDQAFFTVFKSLLSSFPMKDATTSDVIAITNLVTKKDYGPWFERYLIGSEWPPMP